MHIRVDLITTFHSGIVALALIPAGIVVAEVGASEHFFAVHALDFEDVLAHLDAVVDLIKRVARPLQGKHAREVVVVERRSLVASACGRSS